MLRGHSFDEVAGAMNTYVYSWGNNRRRAELMGRPCVVLARGRMNSILIRFLDTGERVVTSRNAIRRSADAS